MFSSTRSESRLLCSIIIPDESLDGWSRTRCSWRSRELGAPLALTSPRGSEVRICPHNSWMHCNNSLSWVQCEVSFGMGSVENVRYFLRSLKEIKHCIRRGLFDIAHIHFSSSGSFFRKVLVARVLQRHNVAYLLHAHGSAFESFYQKLPGFLKMRGIFFLKVPQD